MADAHGPAVFGIIKPTIVLPQWVLDAPATDRALILAHEQSHARAGDHRSCCFWGIVTAAFPWNPFVWFQAKRLRFAIEADCDARVLSNAADTSRYAALLISVGTRTSGMLTAAALAEHRSTLERRIHMMLERMSKSWRIAGLAGVAGVVVTVFVCESRLPQEPAPPQQAMRVAHEPAAEGLDPQCRGTQ